FAAATAGRRKLKLIKFAGAGTISECHILYIGISEKVRVGEILRQMKGRPVLTVSDLDSFCEMGGCIRFARSEKTMGLVISPANVQSQGLRIAADLMAIAKIYEKRAP